jgi:hypothetical protein
MNQLFKVTGDRFQLNVPIMKFDERTGEFEGWMAVEELDHAKEIIDLDASLPYFQKWQEKYAKATDGQSFGNVREQHDPKKAAGKLTAPLVQGNTPDGKPGFYVRGVAVDPVSKQKLADRVLCALSIGGEYVEKKPADEVAKGAIRYVADPAEVSLVDAPCMPSAMITVVKADGSETIAKAVGFTPSQFWSCRAGNEHGHVTKADAKACDGSAQPNKANAGEELRKSLYGVSELIALISHLRCITSDAEWDATWREIEGKANDPTIVAQLKEITTKVFDVLEAMLATERAELEGAMEAETETLELSDLVGRLMKSPTATQILKSLRVPSGNGSKSQTQEPVKEETVEKKTEVQTPPAAPAAPVEKADTGDLAKSIGDLTKAVTDMHADVKKDRERVDNIEKGLDGLSAAFSKTLAFITGVKVEDDTDLEQVTKAIQGKPATPKAVARPVSKSADTETPATEEKKPEGHPLVTGARLIAAL